MPGYSRRRILQGIGAGIAAGAAGCAGTTGSGERDGIDSGVPTPDEEGATPPYISLDFVEAERDLEDRVGRLVAVEGWLQYDDNEQWWDDDSERRWLETYDLFGTHPLEADNPERLGSVTVVDDGSMSDLPDSVYIKGEPIHVRVEGRADILFPELGGPGAEYSGRHEEAQQYGEPLIKAHGYEPREDGN